MIETEKATSSAALFNLAKTALSNNGGNASAARTKVTTLKTEERRPAAAAAAAIHALAPAPAAHDTPPASSRNGANAPQPPAHQPPPPPAPLLSRGSASLGCVSPARPTDSSHRSAGSLTRISGNSSQQREYEWRRFLTVEERQGVRQKIKQAYKNACKSYEELLTTVVAIEEELLHISAPSRLDYFKSGCQFDKRVAEKRKQFSSTSDDSADDDVKRFKSEDSHLDSEPATVESGSS